ncbi:MAG: protein-glutamate O-methyltransferase CheR [Anaerolineae bacterium]|nr:protein-glutamate O-methyltransferase CheR [Anaerolineae bacterium]
METLEYNYVKRKILTLTGVDLNGYKSPQMQRRLDTFLQRSGHLTWQSFFSSIGHDPTVISKLRDYLTINVSSFFRDSQKFDCLREIILPELLAHRSTLRIWSAGCSRGHEPYSLAVLLAEITGSYRQHYILATDIDHSALAWAQAGGPYLSEEVANVPSLWLRRYFILRDNGYFVADTLRRRITFGEHNLLADPFEQGFDLIICRNVVIYFTAEAKDQIYLRFHQSLRPGGILFVGGTEIISQAAEMGFETAGISFYRRRIGTAPAPPRFFAKPGNFRGKKS